ncbi:uncharacterized protein LOC126145920 isoform X1 [Schistocerca cancellata]|uniref:uncharacterized protein LOC126145920 isoform X1 n=2 Tax=Schistocerca cancellata TaxID=274614 RepID=UPI0021189B4D|nr:uncharacterized protein LOC126145920 isoform X1 [Schistocerca cancellata]
MEARALLVAAVASVTVFLLVSADLMAAGPYAADLLEFGGCDDGEYRGMTINVSQILDEETNETTYRGDITVFYDVFADENEVEILAFKWGSTGGWSQIYYLNYTKPYEYTKTNFPLVFDLFFVAIGMDKKPVTPGVYHMHRFMPKRVTMEKFVAFPYGKFKLYTKGLKDGERLSCLQILTSVYEVENSKGMGFKPAI